MWEGGGGGAGGAGVGEVQHGFGEGADAVGDVAGRHGLGRMVADAVGVAQEQHADVGDASHGHAVVAGPAEDGRGILGRRRRGPDALADDVLEERSARYGRGGVDLAGTPAQASTPHDLVELTGQGVPHAIALTVELAAQVEGELHLARHDVHAAGEGFEAADGADDVVLGAAESLDGEGTFACPEKRVAAHVVGGSAGVPGLPFDREEKAARTGDRGDDGERLASAVELGPLFDMRLEVSDELVGPASRLADAARVEPELQERLTKRRAVGVGEAPPFVAPHAPHSGGSEQGRAEPGSLFVPEGDDLQREAESRPPLLVGAHTQQAHDLQGHEHAEHAVEATGVRNGV